MSVRESWLLMAIRRLIIGRAVTGPDVRVALLSTSGQVPHLPMSSLTGHLRRADQVGAKRMMAAFDDPHRAGLRAHGK
jgi:hypothetical protein